MPRIRLIGIPLYAKDRFQRFWRQGWTTRLWQLFLVLVVASFVYLALSSGAIIIGAIAGILLSAILADDVVRLWQDIWHRRWASVRVNLGM